jgi:hypothetical protein
LYLQRPDAPTSADLLQIDSVCKRVGGVTPNYERDRDHRRATRTSFGSSGMPSVRLSGSLLVVAPSVTFRWKTAKLVTVFTKNRAAGRSLARPAVAS